MNEEHLKGIQQGARLALLSTIQDKLSRMEWPGLCSRHQNLTPGCSICDPTLFHNTAINEVSIYLKELE